MSKPLTKTNPFKHQARLIEETKNHEYFAYFMEQGTGKTFVTIAVATHLFYEGKIDGMVVLAPNGVHDNWILNEIPTHCAISGDELLTAAWRGSAGVKRMAYWDYACSISKAEKPFVVLSANIEALRTDLFTSYIRKFMAMRRVMLVIDESTIVKNPRADQTKSAIKLARIAPYRRILSGTPITQSPLDLWAQCQILSPTALPYSSYTAFKHMFAIEQSVTFGHRSFNKIIGYQNQNLLAELIKPFSARVLKAECLDLPEKVYNVRYVELTPEQRKHYKEVERECYTVLGKETVTITQVIVKLLRLHQITLGYVGTDEGGLVAIPNNRATALQAVIEEEAGDKKWIVFVRFLEDVEIVEKAIKATGDQRAIVRYTGSEDSTSRSDNVKRFQEDPNCAFMIATKAAARGLTLTAASRVVYYSQDFSLEARLQSEDRPHRIGQKETVVYTDIVCRGTVDVKVVDALKRKLDLARAIVDTNQVRELVQLTE